MYIKTKLYEHKVFDNNLAAVRKNKVPLKLNKPANIGMCIWELSKVLMYKFHYDYIKNKYESKSKLLFTDIDSLIYETKTEDVYEAAIKKCLISVIIQLSQNTITIRTN